MTALVAVTFDALTAVGPKATSLPITIVQAASRDVLLECVTDRTLILCGYIHQSNERQILDEYSFHAGGEGGGAGKKVLMNCNRTS